LKRNSAPASRRSPNRSAGAHQRKHPLGLQFQATACSAQSACGPASSSSRIAGARVDYSRFASSAVPLQKPTASRIRTIGIGFHDCPELAPKPCRRHDAEAALTDRTRSGFRARPAVRVAVPTRRAGVSTYSAKVGQGFVRIRTTERSLPHIVAGRKF